MRSPEMAAAPEAREALLTEMLDTTRRTSSRSIAAHASDERILKKARQQEAQILRHARKKHERLVEEWERLTELAATLRERLSTVLVSTLEQLTPNTDAGPDSSQ